MRTIGFDWNAHPEMDEQLKQFWEVDGRSASEICRIFNNDRISRNAVIGRIHRLGLVCHKSDTERKPVVPYKRKRINIPKPPEVKAAPVLEPIDPPVPAVSPEVHIDKGCRHITGHIGEPGWQYCGNECKSRYQYCEFHYRKVYDPVASKQMRKTI